MENNTVMQTTGNDAQVPVTMGYDTLEGFKLMQRVAQMFAQSSLVPKNYQGATR